MKKTVQSLLLLLCVLMFASCDKSSVTKLNLVVSQMNQSCPLNEEGVGELIGVEYNKSINEVVLTAKLSEYALILQALKLNDELARDLLKLNYKTDISKDFIDLLAEAGSALKWKCESDVDGQTYEITLSSLEIKEISESNLSEIEIAKLRLDTQVNLENLSCPYVVDIGLMMNSVGFEDGCVVWEYEVDEDIYDMNAFIENQSQLKNAIRESINIEGYAYLKGLFVELNKSMVYRYKGAKSGKILEIEFSPGELH